MQRGRSAVSLSDLIGAGLLRSGQELSFRRSDDVVAVLTESGGLRFKGDEYRSPSTAGRAAAGGVATNGWVAWFAKSGHERVSLARLRDQFNEGKAK
jgi:hypothetical protein